MPKISVLIPVYKTNPDYLKEAVQSVLNQTFANFELLVLDDCPEDSREDVVKSFQNKRIKYFKNGKNLGITPSRNKLIDLDDFPKETTHAGKHTTQLAHALEWFLGYMIYRQGFVISDGAVSTRKQQLYHQKIYLENLLTPVVRFLWQKK